MSSMTTPGGLRKRLLRDEVIPAIEPGEIDISGHAVVAFSSEDAEHPVENLFDGHDGRGGSFWAAARPNTTAHIVLEFDRPQTLSRMVYEVEEDHIEGRQEVRVEISADGAQTYRQILVQQFTFSPGGATFQHEDQKVSLAGLTHLRLTIVPDNRGPAVAKLTSLRLYG
jgi:F5/8 type C domain